MNYTPHPYQELAIEFGKRRLYTEAGEGPAGCGLLLDPGLGKTSITLSLISWLKEMGELRSALVVAPLRVCRSVWPVECEKWGFDLKVSVMTGTPRERRRALNEEADVYVINPEGLAWLAKEDFPPTKFCTLVLDESTKFKAWGTKRHKLLRKELLGLFERRMILTGTPTPNTYADLFAQIYVLDDGALLGETEHFFRRNWMYKGVGYQGRGWGMTDTKSHDLMEAIAPLVLRLDAEDHLDMPELVDNVIPIQLPAATMKEYRRLERELFIELDGADVVASSAGAMYSMCRGVANGGVYVDDGGGRRGEYVHDAKVDALLDLKDELGGKPLLVPFAFKHDRDRIRTKIKDAPSIDGETKAAETDRLIDAWNAGEVPVLLCHPQAMSHGLNLQQGGRDIAWFGMTDSLEQYQQLNARLHRQGARGQTRIHHLVALGTVDEAIHTRLHAKAERQTSLLDFLNAYRRRKR